MKQKAPRSGEWVIVPILSEMRASKTVDADSATGNRILFTADSA